MVLDGNHKAEKYEKRLSIQENHPTPAMMKEGEIISNRSGAHGWGWGGGVEIRVGVVTSTFLLPSRKFAYH